MTKKRPFLKWAGNKYRCLEKIISEFPSDTRLVEPFTGSGVVFLNSAFDSFILAEANPDLVKLYQSLQKHGMAFIDYCEKYFIPKNNSAEKYYFFREKFNQCRHSKKRAALFLYLNRHGYNGLCRYNLKGGYNVPFGRYTKPYFPHKELMYFYEKSHSAQFIKNDFRKTFKLAKEGDVIYCDPPYVPLSSSANFSAYYASPFDMKEQEELAFLAEEAVQKGINVLISNHDTELTRKLYSNAQIKSFFVDRFISCNSDRRLPVRELLAIYRPS